MVRPATDWSSCLVFRHQGENPMRASKIAVGVAAGLIDFTGVATASTTDSGFVRLQIRHDNAFAEVENASTGDGAHVIQSLRQKPDYQPGQWSIVPVSPGSNVVSLVNRNSG